MWMRLEVIRVTKAARLLKLVAGALLSQNPEKVDETGGSLCVQAQD